MLWRGPCHDQCNSVTILSIEGTDAWRPLYDYYTNLWETAQSHRDGVTIVRHPQSLKIINKDSHEKDVFLLG